jgi:hypothetical protein
MKKINLLISMICVGVAFLAVSKASANSCFLATESGSSANCDSGTAQSGLPKHEMKTTSKAGTTGLCNNVNVFADKKQAEEYAKTHEYDYVSASSGCYKPRCTYTRNCTDSSRICCKSLVNGECWHECDICTFNKIGKEFYPYADDTLEGCKLVGNSGMDYISALHTSTNTNKNYKINALRNLEPLSAINTSIWKCNVNDKCKRYGQNNSTDEDYDCDTITSILTDCKTKAFQTKYVQGYNQQSTAPAKYLCLNGTHFDLTQSASDFAQTYGCPLSAVQCNEDKLYYASEERCQLKSLNNHPCSVVKTYKGYGDSECWHKAERCSDFGHDDYITGNYNSLTCLLGSNTQLKYYCPKGTENCDAGSAVTLNDKKCGACECVTGTTRLSSCNDVLYDISRGYYDAKKTCEFHGYTMAAWFVSSGNCTACPYNAMYWKCN